MNLIDRWRRRYWRKDPAAIEALSGTHPAVVITGGSDGIGQALAMAFATPDTTLVLVARNAAKLDAAQHSISSEVKATGAVLTLAQDITIEAAPTNIREFLNRHDLYADLLINSAGIGTTGPMIVEPVGKTAAIAELNVTALTRMCSAFLPDMVTRGQGGIINVASLGGFAPGPYQAAYYASKAYVISLTRALAYENRGQGVRIATLAPGPVNTDFHERANGDTALYRYILPAMSPEAVAASTTRGYAFGQTVIIPGLFSNLTALAMRILPAMLTMPIIAILLKPRPRNS